MNAITETGLWIVIGIGGHLAMSPLPHHRAYGSVPRRFGRLSRHGFLKIGQPERVEVGAGERPAERRRKCHPPRPAIAARREDGVFGVDAALP